MKLPMNGYPVDGWPGQKELRDLGDADKSLTNPGQAFDTNRQYARGELPKVPASVEKMVADPNWPDDSSKPWEHLKLEGVAHGNLAFDLSAGGTSEESGAGLRQALVARFSRR